ncbi:MAG: type IV secretory system conjugative DNA transfer family protein [Acidimicrobiales bacterium]
MRFLIRPAKDVPTTSWIRENTFIIGDIRIPVTHDEGNLAITGGVGSGKTTLLLAYAGDVLKYIPGHLTTVNAIVGDPKNDLLPALRSMDLPLKVISAHVLDRSAWAWRMWEDITDPVAAEQLAFDILPDERTGSENKFYSDAPRLRFAAVLSELVRLGRPWTLRQAYLLAMSEWYTRHLIQRSQDAKTWETEKLFDENQGSTKANIHTSLIVKLRSLATYASMMERCKGSYSIKQLVRGEQVLVLGSDFRYRHILDPLNQLILNFMKRELVAQPDSRTRRHYVLIDEFPQLNSNQPSEEFPAFVEVGRSRGIRVVIVMQTPRQLVRLYGPEGTSTLLGQCLNKIMLRHADFDGASDCSNLLGRVHRYEWVRNVTEGTTRTKSRDGISTAWSRNVGASEVWADRPLVHAQEIMDLPLASWKRGIAGFAICPALSNTKRWRLNIGPDWIREHVADLRSPYDSERCGEIRGLPDPLPRDLVLHHLTPDEAKFFGLDFDPNGYRP